MHMYFAMIILWSLQNDGLVNAEKDKPYEDGVQLSKDGLSCFLQQSVRSALNLNSRCILLWVNVASFCITLLTRDGDGLSGILSSRVAFEKYCVSQLRNIWKLMKSNMQLTDEELSYLVMMCMRRYLQVGYLNLIYKTHVLYFKKIFALYCRLGWHPQTRWMGSLQVQEWLHSMNNCGTVMSLYHVLRILKQRYVCIDVNNGLHVVCPQIVSHSTCLFD